nr:DUF1464 domain-containing protein [Candidatus Bathyarchaeota archaeon]
MNPLGGASLVRVCGIDPGTGSWDIVGLDDEKVVLDTSIPTREVVEKPSRIVNIVKSMGDLDLVVAPSGYGLPLVRLDELDESQLFLLTLKREKEAQVIGLEQVVTLLREEGVEGYVIPGVKHLPSIPPHRKVNKVDMGTADKLCSVALALWETARERNVGYGDVSFILVEMGGGFTAVLGVQKGEIVDAIGGAEGCIGFMACGGLDAEVAYLLGEFDKRLIYTGGATYIAGYEDITPSEFSLMTGRDERFRIAWDALMEGTVKDVASVMVSLDGVDCILLSGRLARVESIWKELERRLSFFAQTRRVKGFTRIAKEAAQGAALIANGLAGGSCEALVESLRIKEAKGTVLDYIFFERIRELRRNLGV